MTDKEEVMQIVHGRVKWFDPSKGFGFIVSDQTDADILLHANVLRNFGQGSVADGAGIEVRIQRTQRGVQAVEVLCIEPPEGTALAFGEDAAQMVGADILLLPLELPGSNGTTRARASALPMSSAAPRMSSSMPRCCECRALPT